MPRYLQNVLNFCGVFFNIKGFGFPDVKTRVHTYLRQQLTYQRLTSPKPHLYPIVLRKHYFSRVNQCRVIRKQCYCTIATATYKINRV